jgi:hypothetical protein
MKRNTYFVLLVFVVFFSCDSDPLEEQKIGTKALVWQEEPSYTFQYDHSTNPPEKKFVELKWSVNKLQAKHQIIITYSNFQKNIINITDLSFTKNLTTDYVSPSGISPSVIKEVLINVTFENETLTRKLIIK